MAFTIYKYLRLSAEDIDLDGFNKYESCSIVNQRALLDDFISQNFNLADCEVKEELDDGWTGMHLSRPGVQRLIELAQNGKVQCIIVKDLSRWCRNYLEAGDFLEQKFPAWGVRFISVNDIYDSARLNGATAGIDIAFRNLVYELYSRDLSEKIRSAKLIAAKSGKSTNAFAFYGYAKDPNDIQKMVIDPPAAEVVRRIFGLAAQGASLKQITNMLNDEHIPTPHERKAQIGAKLGNPNANNNAAFWCSSLITQILKDERYTGKFIYGKTRTLEAGSSKVVKTPVNEWIIVPGAIPAIISEEQFKAASEYFGKRSYSKSGHSKYEQSQDSPLFLGKMKCVCCGRTLLTVKSKQGAKYICRTPKATDRYDCPAEWLYENDITSAVLTALQQQIAFADEARKMLETNAAQILPNIEKLNNEIRRINKLVDKAKTEKMALWEKYHTRVITGDIFQRENEKADMRIRDCEAKVEKLQSLIHDCESEAERENLFVERFSRGIGLQELTRKAVDEFIGEIKVYSPERIEIVFNFADEYAKVARMLAEPKKKKGKIKTA